MAMKRAKTKPPTIVRSRMPTNTATPTRHVSVPRIERWGLRGASRRDADFIGNSNSEPSNDGSSTPGSFSTRSATRFFTSRLEKSPGRQLFKVVGFYNIAPLRDKAFGRFGPTW